MKVIKKSVEYAGVVEPRSPEELEIEIFGLKNAICQAKELISRHEQAIVLARLMLKQEENAHAAVEAGGGGGPERENHNSPQEDPEE